MDAWHWLVLFLLTGTMAIYVRGLIIDWPYVMQASYNRQKQGARRWNTSRQC